MGMEIRDKKPDNPVELTQRELEVLKVIIEGKSTEDVAKILFISKRTVDYHLTQIYKKLNVSNRIQAFRRTIELGLLD